MNNYVGHGFYQFSPELFYRAFDSENGFEVRRMQLFEHCYPDKFYQTSPHEITDSAKIGKRVQLVNNRPTLLLVEARRTEEKPIFGSYPQQSFYTARWTANLPSKPASVRAPMILRRRFKQIGRAHV